MQFEFTSGFYYSNRTFNTQILFSVYQKKDYQKLLDKLPNIRYNTHHKIKKQLKTWVCYLSYI